MRASAHKFSQKILGEGGVRLLATLFVLFLARRLGAEEFGRYSTALAYAALCLVFVDMGTTFILTRDMARHPENRLVIAGSSHFLKLVASLGSWFLLWAVTYLLHFSPDQRNLTLCLGIVTIGQALTEYFCALLNGMEEMGWEAVLKIVSRTLAFGPGFIALALHQPLRVVVTGLAVGSLASYAASVGILKYRMMRFGICFDPPFLKYLLNSSVPIFGSVIFWILYDSQDILLLNYFRFSPKEIGWFAAAMKIIDVIRVYPVLVMGVFFPTLSKLHASDPTAFKDKTRRIFVFMLGTLTCGAAMVYLLAPWLIGFLFKSDFLPSVHYLQLLAPVLITMGLNHAEIQVIIALNRERRLFTAALLVCLSNIVLAWILMPRFGVPGACYALLGSEVLYFFILRHVARSET